MNRIAHYIAHPVSIAPLASFRALFGGVMFVSVLRFWLNGWVDDLYLKPTFFFKYYGFEWVQPLGAAGMYGVFGLMALSALGICLGAGYRLSALTFFLTWTYVELLDVTNYLNHYYFVTIAAFLLIWVPAHRSFSVDAWRKPAISIGLVPRWVVGIFKLQLGMVYFFAGLAKVQADWLLRAQPMRIWLPSRGHYPVLGWLFRQTWAAYLMSWLGCIYDLSVPFLLLWSRVRLFAYAAVIGFHLITWWLFPIGMFPFIMILGTLVFFSAEWHEKVQGQIMSLVRRSKVARPASSEIWKPNFKIAFLVLVCVHFAFQVLLPMRYLLYPQDLFWHEQGYRFSWRVMLMEKAGYASFQVRDPRTGRSNLVRNSDFLQPQQERMMSTQPDLILQFAHFLDTEYQRMGIADPEVYAEVYVTLNGSGSRLFIDPEVDLSAQTEGFAPKDFILPFEQTLPTYSQETR